MAWGATAPLAAQNYERMRSEVKEEQEDTRENIDFLRAQIERIESQVSETATEYDQLYRQFQQLEQEINLRNQVVEELADEGQQIADELEIIQRSYGEYEEDLQRLIKNYRQFMKQVYMQGEQQEIMLLLTSESLSQAQVRGYYLRRFRDYRERQAAQIRETQQQYLEQEREKLELQERNQQNLAEARQERNQLRERREQQQQTISKLQQDRRSLEAQLEQTRQEIDNLTSLFNELLAEEEEIQQAEAERMRNLEAERQRRLAEAREIEDAGEREAEIARLSEPVSRSSTGAYSADELEGIASDFAAARGELPWPTSEGVISRGFGNYVHPVHRTTIPNPGIHISTEPRAEVQAVHSGHVVDVRAIMGFDDMVFITHGSYVTAYANLTEVLVRKGERVSPGDIIGRAGDENSTNGSTLIFFVRDGSEYVDPQQWISSRPGNIP
ncbi:MAG: murein hydrolase activator EnvC family protein [Cyclonatronaceae bacterium]